MGWANTSIHSTTGARLPAARGRRDKYVQGETQKSTPWCWTGIQDVGANMGSFQKGLDTSSEAFPLDKSGAS